MSDVFELIRLIDSKNEINKRRRRYLSRARAVERRFVKDNHIRREMNRIPWELTTQFKWHEEHMANMRGVVKEIQKWLDRYESMKKMGKKRTPKLRRMAKKLNARMLWDSAGYCDALIVKRGEEEIQYNRFDMERIAEHVKIEKLLFGAQYGEDKLVRNVQDVDG